jgi:hypothetical protein
VLIFLLGINRCGHAVRLLLIADGRCPRSTQNDHELGNSPAGWSSNMMATWMEAAEQNVIPTAFVVDRDSQIASIGHPMALTDSIIEQVLAGGYDLKSAALDYTERQEQKRASIRPL